MKRRLLLAPLVIAGAFAAPFGVSWALDRPEATGDRPAAAVDRARGLERTGVTPLEQEEPGTTATLGAAADMPPLKRDRRARRARRAPSKPDRSPRLDEEAAPAQTPTPTDDRSPAPAPGPAPVTPAPAPVTPAPAPAPRPVAPRAPARPAPAPAPRPRPAPPATRFDDSGPDGDFDSSG